MPELLFYVKICAGLLATLNVLTFAFFVAEASYMKIHP